MQLSRQDLSPAERAILIASSRDWVGGNGSAVRQRRTKNRQKQTHTAAGWVFALLQVKISHVE